MIIVATPSRTELIPYQTLESDVLASVREINERYGTSEWEPIVLVHENVHAELLAAIYRAADLCLVSSLQDGMNLVAKEFVAAQVDEHGVLVLSRFTGAAEEIEQAVLINPFNVAGFADGIRAALEMARGRATSTHARDARAAASVHHLRLARKHPRPLCRPDGRML